MPSKSKVCFFFETRSFRLDKRTILKQFIESIFKREKKRLESINYVFCSDRRLLEINRRFLHHDFYTDIISFDLSETDAARAEVYISIDRVRENAKTLGLSFSSELKRVIFHGALHLCGYGDKGKTEKAQMRKREDHYLGLYGKK